MRALEHNELAVPEADEAVAQRLRTKALLAKHLSALEETGGAAAEGQSWEIFGQMASAPTMPPQPRCNRRLSSKCEPHGCRPRSSRRTP